MSQLNERGANSERNSALWGTGGRGGDRSSVLWGKGGRGIVVGVMVVALAAPLAATASKAKQPLVQSRPASHQLAPAKKAKLAPTKKATKAKHATAVKAKAKAKAKPAKTTKVTPKKAKPTSAAAVPATTPVVAAAPAAAPAAPAVPQGGDSNSSDGNTYVAPVLLTKSENTPDTRVQVIISSSGGTDGAKEAVKWLAKLAAQSNDASDLQNTNLKDLDVIGAVSLSIPAKWLDDLRKVPGLIVTPDAMVKTSGILNLKSTQLWPYETGNSNMWLGDQAFYSSSTPAIAVIDSGVEQRSDFGSRVIASVNLSTIPGNTSLNDERGHGTFVAGIAAGASPDLTGADPAAPIVSIKVMDQNGQARTSDVITACQWILDNKAKYNIRIANFSLHSSFGLNFYRDPLDRAVEKLWFSNVVVVAAAGNYGTAAGPSGVKYSPGNDPFVITVGALDLGGTAKTNDDTVAPFSAYGYTFDGFFKPEISAPGRYMVGPVPTGSALTIAKALNMVGTDRVQLSGTSFSAPVVSGTVAQMLARHPNMTPDQVKGALMKSARRLPLGTKGAGVGELTATRALFASNRAPNPNRGLDRFVKADVSGSSIPVFDAQSWASAAKSDMSWNSMSWADQSWSDMSWADQSWSDMSWADMSWADMSWADLSQEDAAEGDATSGTDGYVATPAETAAAATDPDLAVPVDQELAPAPTDTTATATTTTVTDTTTTVTDTTATVTDTATAAVPAPPVLLP